MKNFKMNATAAATIACAASTTISVAGGPGAGCNPAGQCWNLHMCAALVHCFTDPGIDDSLRQLCFDAILNNGYASCMANVCLPSYLGENSPSPQGCLEQFLASLVNCSDWGENAPNSLNCSFNPDITPTPEQKKAMTEACGKAALWQYKMCNHLANGSTPGNFDPNAGILTIPDGAAATGEFEPAEGANHASWLHVPQVEDGDADIDAARLHALLWTEEAGWSWSVVGEYGTADDGMVSVDFDLSSVDSSLWIDALQLVIEWRYDGETVTATPVRLGIAGSNSAADFNRDGTVCVADLVAFLDAYMVGAPRADFNADGVVDGQDLSAFIAAFDAN
ncbi:MAG: GC-type dockerin domain-anchored protein [Phycisphaerales bacterium]